MSTPKIQKWTIDRLVPYEKNAKIHDAKQVAKIAESIKKFGWTSAIVVDGAGVIINGHGRRLAAQSLGLTEVPVWVRDDLTPDQVRAARLADNRVAISDIDTRMLQEELKTLDFDLAGIFDKKELDFLSADLVELNTDAFVDDIDAEVKKQSEESAAMISEVDSREVKIEKALGFKSIKGADERFLAKFMASIESQTGKTGADAFMTFVKGCLA
jgi:hypothetical protein